MVLSLADAFCTRVAVVPLRRNWRRSAAWRTWRRSSHELAGAFDSDSGVGFFSFLLIRLSAVVIVFGLVGRGIRGRYGAFLYGLGGIRPYMKMLGARIFSLVETDVARSVRMACRDVMNHFK
jgi:hypothetical protein